jgi:predicted ribosomally synthesized peptide with nif11-like leader
MSKETVRAFFKVAENDKALEERIKTADSSTNVVQIAAEKGYEFTELELLAFMQEAVAADGELSEEVLAAVAGGLVAEGGDNCNYCNYK